MLLGGFNKLFNLLGASCLPLLVTPTKTFSITKLPKHTTNSTNVDRALKWLGWFSLANWCSGDEARSSPLFSLPNPYQTATMMLASHHSSSSNLCLARPLQEPSTAHSK